MSLTDNLVKVTKWLGYFIALLVIIAATLVSVGRLFTPYLNQHKADFEMWATQLLNVPVEIDQVRISWNAYVPQLTLERVTLLDKATNKPTFDIKQVKINIKVIESLIKREPIPSYIKISGMKLTIHSKKTVWNVEGFGNVAIADDLLGGMHEANEIMAWIFSQPALVLNDIDITFYTRTGLKQSITLDELSLLNSTTKHVLSGKGTLNQDISTHVELALDWRGDSFDIETISANLYVYIEGISLPQWFNQQTFKNMQIKEGLGSAKIWLTLDKGQLQKVQTQLQLYHLSIYSLMTQQTQRISRLSGHFGWKRMGDNQLIAGNDILIDLPNHLWPTTSFSLTLPMSLLEEERVTGPVKVDTDKLVLKTPSKLNSLGLENHVASIKIDLKTKQNHYSMNVSYVDLADIYAFLRMSGLMPDALESTLKTLQPRGEIGSFVLDFEEGAPITNNKIAGKFHRLSWNQWKQYPGVSELSGDLDWNERNGSLNVASENIKLSYASALDTPMVLGKLTGQVQFKKDKKDTWFFNSKKLELLNDDLQIEMSGTAEIPKNESPKVDVISNLEVKKAEHLVRYLPLKMMERDLSSWLMQAFHSGKFVSGKLAIQGRVSDFPYTHNDGKFSLTAEGKDLDFGYALGWPSMKKVNGSVQFVGRQMIADIKSGLLQGMPVQHVHVEIPYIGKQEKQFLLLNGMLEGNIAQGMQLIQHSPLKNKVRKEINALQIAGPMSLKLNVNLPLKDLEHAIVSGDMLLSQVSLGMPVWNMSIDNINGMFRFTEKTVEATGVTARLWGEPIALQVHTESTQKGDSFVNLQIHGAINDSVMHSFVQNTPYSKIIQGSMDYQATLRLGQHQLSEPVQLTIDTDLKGLALNLPMGLGKKAREFVPSKIIAMVKQNKPLEIKWIYGNKLTAAAIIKNSAEGMQLDSVDLNFQDKKQGIEMVGVITLPTKPKSAIQAKFDRLYLAPFTTEQDVLDPTTLPAISFVGNDVRYKDKRLGHVSFDILPIKNGVAIESLHLDSDVLNLSAKGEWLSQNKKMETHVEGKLTTTNVAELLSVWGSPTVNLKDSGGSVVFDLSWPDTVYSPSLSGMTGKVDLSLTSGSIVNLDQATTAKMGIGRILNLLSLDSISRALTFNFKDLTEKGYSFDSVKGQFILKEGSAFTDDVRMEGSIARIEMSGRIGLAAKDYDIKISVTPFVTGSIPLVAAAIAVNPIVGVAAWAVEKIAGKAVSSVTTHTYEVKGTWDKPVWTDK